MNNEKLKAGTLLLAEPFMADPNFKRTVILLCELNEEGAVGFTLTKQAPLMLHEAIDGIPEGFDAPLWVGGPVQMDTLHFLHNLGPVIENTQEVLPGVYWGGDFDQLRDLISSGEVSPDNFIFFLGYSGWSEGQLEDELEENSWILHPAKSRHIFRHSTRPLWKQVLREMGGDYAMMVNFPENPILN